MAACRSEVSQISIWDGSTRFATNKQIRLIELFAGVGSQAMALRDLGLDFDHYRVCEFDRFAMQSYNAIHGTSIETSDIRLIGAEDLGINETDKYCYVMTYSFPCQDLSKAGKGLGMEKGSGTRSGLLWEVERLLDECRELPQVLLMENVPDVIGTKNIRHFAEWIAKLETLGYRNYWQVLNAKDYGIPQNRNRCFMVSLRGDHYYTFPKGVPLELRLRDMLEPEVADKYYLKGAAVEKLLSQLDYENANKICCDMTVNKPRFRDVGNTVKARYDCGITNFAQEGIAVVSRPHGFNKGGLSGGESFPAVTVSATAQGNVGLCYGLYTNARDDFFRPPLNECARTIKAEKHDAGIIAGFTVRKLMPRECWRLMGFTDEDFDKAKATGVSDSQLYKQAGNSIVKTVLMAIFGELFGVDWRSKVNEQTRRHYDSTGNKSLHRDGLVAARQETEESDRQYMRVRTATDVYGQSVYDDGETGVS